ncbi:hypothetical protein IQ225_15985 [Synechocystis salina LEGE 06155]|nr:hypothetical protein [Synechocystis salina LEGE 06155]
MKISTSMPHRLMPDQCLSKPAYRLYQAGVYGRWLVVALLWCTLIPWSLWQFREDIVLLQDHFTWVAIRYGFAFQLVPAFTLFASIGFTGAVLVRQSCHLLWGLSIKERNNLIRGTARIRKIGPRHPLWRWLFR